MTNPYPGLNEQLTSLVSAAYEATKALKVIKDPVENWRQMGIRNALVEQIKTKGKEINLPEEEIAKAVRYVFQGV